MDKQSTDHKEETLVAMLASFRKEACYHDTFEEDFLRNFHLRKETDQAAHSAWKLLLGTPGQLSAELSWLAVGLCFHVHRDIGCGRRYYRIRKHG